jgi:hypothetical protein
MVVFTVDLLEMREFGARLLHCHPIAEGQVEMGRTAKSSSAGVSEKRASNPT